jgi:hypothetical protein
MSRWYQNVLTGVRVEVKTLEEDDFYAANSGNWARVYPAEAPKATPKQYEKPSRR